MFFGSLPQDVINMFCDIVKEWETDNDCKKLYVGCSGNFTIERALGSVWTKPIIGNDVTIYSSALGRYFAGKKICMKYKEEYDGNFTFVKDYTKTKEDLIATMLMLSNCMKFDRPKDKMLEYDRRMINAYKVQWPELHEKSVKKLESMKTRINDFYCGDVCKMIDEVSEQDAVICYPPFFSGDYEKMFAALENVFAWKMPQYDMIDKEKIYELFRKMTMKRHFIFGVDEYLPEFEEWIVGLSQTTNRGRQVCIYSDCAKKRIIVPCQKLEDVMLDRISETDDIKPDDDIKLVRLSSEEFHQLRSLYMNAKIKPGQETLAIGIAINKKLIGVYAFSASPTLSGDSLSKYMEMPMIYMLSDFPVSTTKYKRLAKLVLYSVLSKDSRMIAEHMTKKRVRSVSTTAFSKNQVSMKYRGLFDLLVKQKMEEKNIKNDADISDKYYNSGYKLCYGTKFGDWTLQEGLKIWCEKHSVIKKDGEQSEN